MSNSQTGDVRSDTDNLTCTSGSSPPSTIKSVRIDEIHVDKTGEKSELDSETVAALAQSIPMHGMLHPITVRACSTGYQLVAGRHRLEAARKAGLDEVEVKVVDVDDREAMALGLVENLRRRKLSAAEETAALVELLALEVCMEERGEGGGGESRDVSPRNRGVTRVAEKTGKSKTAVSLAASREKRAHPDVSAAFKGKRLKAGQVDELVRVEPEVQAKLLPIAVGLTRNQLRTRVDEELGISRQRKGDDGVPDAGSFIAAAMMLVRQADSLDTARLGESERELLRTTSEELVAAFGRVLDGLRSAPVEDAASSADGLAAPAAVSANAPMGQC